MWVIADMRLKNETKQLINVLMVYLGARHLRLSLHGLDKSIEPEFVTKSSETVGFISYALLPSVITLPHE